MENNNIIDPIEGNVVFVKEADLQIVADMQKRICNLEELMQWGEMCLFSGEIVPRIENDCEGEGVFITLITQAVNTKNELKEKLKQYEPGNE